MPEITGHSVFLKAFVCQRHVNFMLLERTFVLGKSIAPLYKARKVAGKSCSDSNKSPV